MNTISTNQNTINLYTQSTGQATNVSDGSKVHHHKKHTQADSVEISEQALQVLGSTAQGTAGKDNPLDDLVTAGTITQDQANAIQSAFQAGGNSIKSSGTYNNRPKNPLDSLVSTGVITQKQETAIKNAFETVRKANQPTSDTSNTTKTNPLDSLVSAGTITQDQENAIQDAFEAAM
jgi:competence protein ComGC